MVTSVV